jgi:hypothetical protein
MGDAWPVSVRLFCGAAVVADLPSRNGPHERWGGACPRARLSFGRPKRIPKTRRPAAISRPVRYRSPVEIWFLHPRMPNRCACEAPRLDTRPPARVPSPRLTPLVPTRSAARFLRPTEALKTPACASAGPGLSFALRSKARQFCISCGRDLAADELPARTRKRHQLVALPLWCAGVCRL